MRDGSIVSVWGYRSRTKLSRRVCTVSRQRQWIYDITKWVNGWKYSCCLRFGYKFPFSKIIFLQNRSIFLEKKYPLRCVALSSTRARCCLIAGVLYIYIYIYIYICIYIYVHTYDNIYICTYLDWYCFYYFVRNSLVALLEALLYTSIYMYI